MKKKILILCLALAMLLSVALPVFAEEMGMPQVYDAAELLSAQEETDLIAKLEALDLFAAVVTTDNLDGKSPMEYADDFYDRHYGAPDGILLLISTEDNDWWISTCGYGIHAFTDAGIVYMGDQFVPYLSDGDYAAACDTFADLCRDFLSQAATGDPYDSHNLPKAPFDFVVCALIALVVGFVLALIVTGSMKNKLKTHMQSHAASYVKRGSMQITIHKDLYLYSTITRRRRENQGGSSTHRSSSGRSHGGGGGKF